jgi:hypothetical protein
MIIVEVFYMTEGVNRKRKNKAQQYGYILLQKG